MLELEVALFNSVIKDCNLIYILTVIKAGFLSAGYKSLEIYVSGTLLEVGNTIFLRQKLRHKSFVCQGRN